MEKNEIKTPQNLHINTTQNTPINTPLGISSPIDAMNSMNLSNEKKRSSFSQGLTRLMEKVQNSQKTIDQVLDKTSVRVSFLPCLFLDF